MSVHVVVDVGLKDRSDAGAFDGCAERTDGLLEEAGARVIAFDPTPKVLEGSWSPRTVVIRECPDVATVERVQRSDAYAPLKALRQRVAGTNAIVARGS